MEVEVLLVPFSYKAVATAVRKQYAGQWDGAENQHT